MSDTGRRREKPPDEDLRKLKDSLDCRSKKTEGENPPAGEERHVNFYSKNEEFWSREHQS